METPQSDNLPAVNADTIAGLVPAMDALTEAANDLAHTLGSAALEGTSAIAATALQLRESSNRVLRAAVNRNQRAAVKLAGATGQPYGQGTDPAETLNPSSSAGVSIASTPPIGTQQVVNAPPLCEGWFAEVGYNDSPTCLSSMVACYYTVNGQRSTDPFVVFTPEQRWPNALFIGYYSDDATAQAAADAALARLGAPICQSGGSGGSGGGGGSTGNGGGSSGGGSTGAGGGTSCPVGAATGQAGWFHAYCNPNTGHIQVFPFGATPPLVAGLDDLGWFPTRVDALAACCGTSGGLTQPPPVCPPPEPSCPAVTLETTCCPLPASLVEETGALLFGDFAKDYRQRYLSFLNLPRMDEMRSFAEMGSWWAGLAPQNIQDDFKRS